MREQRDPKCFYKQGRVGGIPTFNGIASSYEPPEPTGRHLRSDQACCSKRHPAPAGQVGPDGARFFLTILP